MPPWYLRMGDALAGLLHDAAVVLEDGRRVDATRDRPARVDFLRHRVRTLDGAVLGDGGVRVLGEAPANAGRGKGAARLGDVLCRARPRARLADALRRLGRARQVGVLRLIRDARAGRLRDLVQPLVRARHRTTVAAAHLTTVEDVLHRKVDVDALGLASDLDAVPKR